MKSLLLLLSLLLFLISPSIAQLAKENTENPPAPGFNLQESDAKAIQIADQVMQAMGGRQNWDQTRYIAWTFFGRRKLLWDKWQGDVRIEVDSTIYLMNIAKNTGKVKKGNEIITQPDSIKKYVDRGVSIWINDSYWLVMPFKLKDSGVTLKYMGEQKTTDGKPADVLQLTFQNVGRTPENKYFVYVDQASHLVQQWDYFQKYTDEKPSMSTPWENYEKKGTILLSGDRGSNRKLENIHVFNNVPESAFTSFDPINYSKLK